METLTDLEKTFVYETLYALLNGARIGERHYSVSLHINDLIKIMENYLSQTYSLKNFPAETRVSLVKAKEEISETLTILKQGKPDRPVLIFPEFLEDAYQENQIEVARLIIGVKSGGSELRLYNREVEILSTFLKDFMRKFREEKGKGRI